MKIFSLFIIASLATSVAVASSTASIDVIYGEDNRKDVFEAAPAFIELSKATAAMIPAANLKALRGEIQISGGTLQSRGICKKERFSQQISAALCSGFLVAGNKLVTAGHCIKSEADCSAYKWVFDYKVDSSEQGAITVANSSVFSCKKIISRKLETFTKDDYALIELDRSVTDRHPVKFRKAGKVAKGDAIVVIGHPSGLPAKVADGANVRSLAGKYFQANLDTYGGNSGSAVFNVKTEEVEGILVRGDNDYVKSPEGCMVSNVCKNDGCRGEEVTFITNIPELKNL